MVKAPKIQTIWAIGLQSIVVLVDMVYGKEIIDRTNDLAGMSRVDSPTFGDIGPITALDPLLGFILGLGFFASAAHFAIYSRPKAYWYAMIAPAILLSLVGWKFLLIELGYIAAGIILGAVVRKLLGSPRLIKSQ